jgi:hypothetical protein
MLTFFCYDESRFSNAFFPIRYCFAHFASSFRRKTPRRSKRLFRNLCYYSVAFVANTSKFTEFAKRSIAALDRSVYSLGQLAMALVSAVLGLVPSSNPATRCF